MEKFRMYNPVKLCFGRGVAKEVGNSVLTYGKKTLLIYGKGSVKHNGAYDDVVNSLGKSEIDFVEYSGIKSNPVIEDVVKAAGICRDKNVHSIVAVGGGSVIDCAKIISVAVSYEGDPWDLIVRKAEPVSAVPLFAVLTLPATGTEMNPGAVIQNDKLLKKIGFRNELMFPKHSFLDPGYTLSVPSNYTAYGIVDLIAHALEAYFGKGNASLTDRFIISIIKEAIEYGPKLINDLQNYQLRQKIMFAATCALNGMTVWGKENQDWGVHQIGHVLSVMYDIPHGASLSMAYPSWLKLFKNRIPERISELGNALFNTDDPDITIERLEDFFKEIGSPVKLSQINIDISKDDVKTKIKGVMIDNKATGTNYEITHDDYDFLLNDMM